jgi:hypothetical protein
MNGNGNNGNATAIAATRIKRRLAASRVEGPSPQMSSFRWVNWEGMGDVLGQPFDMARIPLDKLEQMRRDPMIAFGLLYIKMPILRAKWRIRSKDAKRAAAIDGALREIYGKLVLQYFNSLDYGYSPMVKRFELCQPDWTYIDKDQPDAVEQPVWDNGVVRFLKWRTFIPVHPRRVMPAWTPDGEFNGFYLFPYGGFSYNTTQGIAGGGWALGTQPQVPLEYATWAVNEKESVFNSIWGYPRIGYAYRYWWDYWFKFGLAERAFERWADPPVLAYHPEEFGTNAETGEDDVDFGDDALEMAEKLRSGANVAIPSSVITGYDERTSNVREWDIQQMKVETDFKEIREEFAYLDIMKLRSVGIPEQALIEGRGSSSRNVSATMSDSMMENQAVLASEFANHVNRWVIPQLEEANFGGPSTCKLEITGFDSRDSDMAKMVIQIVGAKDPTKLPIDMEELLEEYGIPLMSHKAMQAALDAQAAAAAATAPDATPAQSGPGTPVAGVATSPAGAALYYDAPDRIVLADRPFVIERVDEITDRPDAVAYFDASAGSLYVRRDADSSLVDAYVKNLQGRTNVELRDDAGYAMTSAHLERFSEQLEATQRAVELGLEDIAGSPFLSPPLPAEVRVEVKPEIHVPATVDGKQPIGEDFVFDDENKVIGKRYVYEEES